MGFRFASLGSGSRGNATLVEAGGTRVLVDCGFAARDFVARCERLGFDPGTLDAILVTHEHGDHVRGVGALARRYDLPVWLSHGSWRAGRCGELGRVERFAGHGGSFCLGALEVHPVPVPHDAREPTQFVFAHGDARLGLLTDLGSITPRVVAAFDGIDALLLECNHDVAMLDNGPYPPSLRARVGGPFGHLNNDQAAGFLGAIDRGRLRHLVAAHISEQNNRPELALAGLVAAMQGAGPEPALLLQDDASDWFEVV